MKSSIFSKTINLIKDHRQEYTTTSSKQNRQGDDSEQENDKLYSTPLVKKHIKKVIMISKSSGEQPQVQQKPQQKEGVLNISKNSKSIIISKNSEPVAIQKGSFSIFVRNLNEKSTQQDLERIINDNVNILGISISNKQANITFSNQQSADKAVEILNNYKESGYDLKAVTNYRVLPQQKVITLQSKKTIEIIEQQLKQEKKQQQEQQQQQQEQQSGLRMYKKESIFDRIQNKK